MQRLLAYLKKAETSLPLRLFLSPLIPLSWLFAAVVRVREWLYRQGLLPQLRSPAFVVSIGNITAGGTGKTPVLLMLLDALASSTKTAVVTRGYKATKKRQAPLDGKEEGSFAYGDEAALIAQRIPHTQVFVSRNKGDALKRACGAECILVDDGFQHFAIQRDLDIVVVDAEEPFGYGYLLPRGLLRQPPSALRRADYLVVNHAGNEEVRKAVIKAIRRYTSCPVIATEPVLSDLTIAPGSPVALLCAIAKPTAFCRAVEKKGFSVRQMCALVDHAPILQEEVHTFCMRAKEKGASCVLVTEKDWVKMAHMRKMPLPICAARMELAILEGEEAFCALVERIRRGS